MFEQISEIDWARAAAFIDGEGNIHISRRGAKGSNRGHYLKLNVTNTDPRLVIWFQSKFGGSINGAGKRQKSNHRQAYRWFASCKTAADILRGCLPYLILKVDQAEVALAFQSTLKGRQGRGIKTPPEIFRQREEYLTYISNLKWRDHSSEWPDKIDTGSLAIVKEI